MCYPDRLYIKYTILGPSYSKIGKNYYKYYIIGTAASPLVAQPRWGVQIEV